jgi:alkylation response protein AidB-like acyl-CoA dehydrogenase
MGGTWPHQYIDSFSMTISQGTSEIQRNQIGERVLGMPKSK